MNFKLKIRLIGFWIAIFALSVLSGCAVDSKNKLKSRALITSRTEVMVKVQTANNIALMLPLKGKDSLAGRAVKNGFLAAYYELGSGSDINIKVIDTSAGELLELYQQAVADGAQLIVGPLLKEQVNKLTRFGELPVPTIALNTLDNYEQNYQVNLFQFGLSPQDEATQIAIKMMQQGSDRCAIIIPEDDWGSKISNSFKRQYLALGGEAVAILRYKANQNLAEQLCPFLAEDEETLCAKKKPTTEQIKEKKPVLTTRRQDINSIFIVANPSEARQLVPLLKFYYAGDLPTYAFSSIYSGVSIPSLDLDLNGIYFCDLPWVIGSDQLLSNELHDLYQKIALAWGGNFNNHLRLYALGVDAYQLAVKFPSFLKRADSGMPAATGKLYLDGFNHVYRELPWATIKNGKPVIIEI